jgi:transcriptional regulator GlxA family with amidase domain
VKSSVGVMEKSTHIAFALVPGFLEASLGITTAIVQTVNALCRAEGQREALQLSVVAPARATIVSANGLKVAHHPLDIAYQADLLLVPGAFIEHAEAMRDWVTQPGMAPWLNVLRDRQASSKPVAASCAGTWLLAESGVLDGCRATSVWWLAAAFRDRYPAVELDTQQMVVSDRLVTTAGAALAQTDLMLHLVARLSSASLAERSARLLLADRREVQSRHTSVSWMVQADPLMRKACEWIDKHLDEPIDVTDLAQALHVTTRTLARRCKQALGISPWRLVQRRRIEAAADLLRTTTLPFEKITTRVGYADPSALRTLFRRELGIAPSSLRTKAGCST